MGVGGMVKGDEGIALITSFTLNNYEINRTNTINILSKSAHMTGEDGFLGFDCLRLNAVILPVGSRRFLFKPGSSPAAPIDHYMGLLGFVSVPLREVKGELFIDGQVNGFPLKAVVDCGAAMSTFDLTYVRKTLGVNVPSLNAYVQGLDGNRSDAYGFTPKTMYLGSLKVDPLEMQACETAFLRKAGLDMLLGYDLLASHQAIIDLGHDTLWLK
jgi:hypothetical protein